MKHIAEQFDFPFVKEFYVFDKVVVTATHEDSFIGQMEAQVVEVCKRGDHKPFYVVKDSDGRTYAVYQHQLKLKK